MTDLRGKVAIVTGAGKGIGRATSLRLARDGVRMVLAATDSDALRGLKREIESSGTDAIAQRCDVTQREDCEKLVRHTLEHFDRVDILINNAGIGYSGKVVDSDPAEVEYYICGPPLMLEAVQEMLDSLGVEPEMIAFDDFGG